MRRPLRSEMRGVVHALILMGVIYALGAWGVFRPHSICDPVNALPWLRCGFSP